VHQWIVFAHILGAILFMLAHGTSAAVVFRLGRERDPDAVRVLLGLSRATVPAMYVTLILLVVAGLWAGGEISAFTNGTLWLWASMALLVLVIVAMYALMSPAFGRLRELVGDGSSPVDEARLDQALREPGPMIGMSVGIVGIVLILWLMVLKPF
jgi:hypothetical protein